MLNVTNLSNNPLLLTDDTMLAAGESRELKALGDREREYSRRGWLNVIEESKPNTAKNTGGEKE
jgi:hypothetical protein